MKVAAAHMKNALTLILMIVFISGSVYGQAKKMQASDTLKIFEKLCDQIRYCKGNYTLAGVINIKNPANPSSDIKNVSFLFCKQGGQFYYRLGATETINEQGLYIYIDRRTKNIMVSAQKQVNYDAGPLKPIDVNETLKSENYRLKSSSNGEFKTISLINDHHISCKQYAITYQGSGLKIKRLLMRLTDASDPLNGNKDEVVDVQITQWLRSADLGKFLTGNQVIRTLQGRYYTTNEFKNYRIIKM